MARATLSGLLFLLLAGAAGAQTLPFDLSDRDSQEVSEYLDQEIRRRGSTHLLNTWRQPQVFRSSITGTAFFLTDAVQVGRDVQSAGQEINSTSFVSVATVTLTMRGERPTVAVGLIAVENDSGATRRYRLRIMNNAGNVSETFGHKIPDGDTHAVAVIGGEASSTEGAEVYVLQIDSNSTNADQKADATTLIVLEF